MIGGCVKREYCECGKYRVCIAQSTIKGAGVLNLASYLMLQCGKVEQQMKRMKRHNDNRG
jgi:hypothetical protein